MAIFHLLDKLFMSESFRIPLRSTRREAHLGRQVAEEWHLVEKSSGLAERRPQIGNVIDVQVRLPCCDRVDDLIVICFKIPILEQGHQYLQPLYRPGIDERILLP